MAATKNHDYHLVDPDPWPLIGAFSALALTGGAVMWIHDNPTACRS
jgi:cytochrome c oxidase subunit III